MRGAEDVDVERVAEDFGGDGGGGGGGGFGGGGGVGVVRGDGEAEWGGGAGGGGGDFVLEEVGGVVDGGACCWGGAREAGGFELGGEGTSARLGSGLVWGAFLGSGFMRLRTISLGRRTEQPCVLSELDLSNVRRTWPLTKNGSMA